MKKVDRIRILGDTGSPYTKKMLAVLRYRQIPYSLIWGTPGPVLDEMGLARPKPLLLPVMVMPQLDGSDVAAVTPRQLSAILRPSMRVARYCRTTRPQPSWIT